MLQEQFEAENLETTAVKRVRHLDWQSIVKATQTISSEMAPARLMPMLLEVVRESAGAQRACILLAQGEQLWLEADLSDSWPKTGLPRQSGRGPHAAVHVPSSTTFSARAKQ